MLSVMMDSTPTRSTGVLEAGLQINSPDKSFPLDSPGCTLVTRQMVALD
jgi:hypothetical protein